MSFILDALKKSESERQRQNGPALFEVKVAPPRSRFALWASILGALLLINGIAVGWVLMRGSTARSAAASAAASAPTAATAGSAQLRNAAPGATVAPAGAASSGTPGVATSAALAATTPPTWPVASAANVPAPAPASPAASPAVPPVASTPLAETGAAQNPDDLAPAVEPTRTSGSGTSAAAGGNATGGGASGVVRATSSGLPTYQDAAAARGANIPELRLDLHSYSSRPDERFVFLNMMKLHEGDTLPQGVHVESITPDGVILSYQGAKFVLQRQ